MKVSSAALAGDLVFNTRNDSNFAKYKWQLGYIKFW
jgi:hypothetical protein